MMADPSDSTVIVTDDHLTDLIDILVRNLR